MAATNGTVIGQFEGTSWATAFTNFSKQDILQVLNQGGKVVFSIDYLGAAHTNPSTPTPTALYQQNGAASLALAFTNPSGLDLLQISSPGGNIVKYVDHLGVSH